MDCIFDCKQFQQYRVDLPYPQVTVSGPNRRYATIISGAFGGQGSEMTAITQYGVHRFYLEQYPDAYTAYLYLSAVEMLHWELLGSLIKSLGMQPKFCSYEDNTFWNGRFPAYRCRFGEIIEADIQGERDAIAHYRRMIRQIPEPQIQALFERIILDEERHIEVLTGLYQRYGSK